MIETSRDSILIVYRCRSCGTTSLGCVSAGFLASGKKVPTSMPCGGAGCYRRQEKYLARRVTSSEFADLAMTLRTAPAGFSGMLRVLPVVEEKEIPWAPDPGGVAG